MVGLLVELKKSGELASLLKYISMQSQAVLIFLKAKNVEHLSVSQLFELPLVRIFLIPVPNFLIKLFFIA